MAGSGPHAPRGTAGGLAQQVLRGMSGAHMCLPEALLDVGRKWGGGPCAGRVLIQGVGVDLEEITRTSIWLVASGRWPLPQVTVGPQPSAENASGNSDVESPSVPFRRPCIGAGWGETRPSSSASMARESCDVAFPSSGRHHSRSIEPASLSLPDSQLWTL
jgi:hypothetical protein